MSEYNSMFNLPFISNNSRFINQMKSHNFVGENINEKTI